LSTGQILFSIFWEYQQGLLAYASLVESRLPRKPELPSSSELNQNEIRTTCLIINTAEYCNETLNSLQESMTKVIDAQFKERIDLSKQQEIFGVLSSKGLTVLVNNTMARVTKVLNAMIRLPWATWANVGDSSDYVNQINAIFLEELPTIIKMLSPIYHGNYCLQVAHKLIPAFEEAIFKCKRVSELGAQQLSLDAHALKTFLLDMPNIGADEDHKAGPTRSFTRYVTREMSRVESILKTLICPTDKLIATFRALLAKDAKSATAAEQLVKIMDLRGLKKSEQQSLVDIYNNTCKPEDKITATNTSGLVAMKSFFRSALQS